MTVSRVHDNNYGTCAVEPDRVNWRSSIWSDGEAIWQHATYLTGHSRVLQVIDIPGFFIATDVIAPHNRFLTLYPTHGPFDTLDEAKAVLLAIARLFQ